MTSIELVIIDDHSVILEGLKSIFKAFPMIHLNEIFSDPFKLFHYLNNNDVNMLLLDMEIPSMNGIEILQKLKLSKPKVKIVIFTQHEGEYYFKEATRIGANGYILKSENIYIVPEILLRIHQGEYYISRELLKYQKSVHSSTSLDSLEHSIIKYLIEGKSIKEISLLLGKSEKVIEYRLSKIRSIFDARTNAELGYKIKEKYFK